MSNHAISVKIDSQIAQNARLGYPFKTWNEILCYEERFSLLLKWLITFLWCISKVGGASDSIYKPLIVQIVSFQSRMTLKLHTKYKIWGTPFATETGQYSKDRYTLLMKWWFLAFLRNTMKMGWASVSIYNPLSVHIVSFPLRPALKLHTICQIWGTLFAQEMRCYTMRRHIHCCWIGL